MAVRRDLKNKVVLITGATGGLGLAMCEAFARRGARLGLLDLEGSALDALALKLRVGGTVCARQVCDVTSADNCRHSIAALAEELGAVDLLVNNAGLTHRSAFVDTELSVHRRVMEVNFFGSLHCTQAALPHLIASRGQILVISSVAGFAPLIGRTGYAASKHALHGMFGSLRAELRPQGVDVLLVSPSFIRTNININALDADGQKTRHPQATVGKVLSAEQAAEKIVRAAERNRSWVFLTPVSWISRQLMSLSPRLYEWVMTRSLRAELQRETE